MKNKATACGLAQTCSCNVHRQGGKQSDDVPYRASHPMSRIPGFMHFNHSEACAAPTYMSIINPK